MTELEKAVYDCYNHVEASLVDLEMVSGEMGIALHRLYHEHNKKLDLNRYANERKRIVSETHEKVMASVDALIEAYEALIMSDM